MCCELRARRSDTWADVASVKTLGDLSRVIIMLLLNTSLAVFLSSVKGVVLCSVVCCVV